MFGRKDPDYPDLSNGFESIKASKVPEPPRPARMPEGVLTPEEKLRRKAKYDRAKSKASKRKGEKELSLKARLIIAGVLIFISIVSQEGIFFILALIVLFSGGKNTRNENINWIIRILQAILRRR